MSHTVRVSEISMVKESSENVENMFSVQAYNKDSDVYLPLVFGIPTLEDARKVAQGFREHLVADDICYNGEPCDWLVIFRGDEVCQTLSRFC